MKENNTVFNREVKDHWNVVYNNNNDLHVKSGLILNPERLKEFDPFIMMAEDWFKRGAFSDHPHRGFQTITYVINGRLEHIDNAGGHSILKAGDVQYMNAGRGARHAEEAVGDEVAHSLQLWLNLPKELKNSPVSYQDVHVEDTPEVSFNGGTVKVYAGNTAGVEGPLKTAVPFTMAEINLVAGAVYTHNLPANHNAFVYVLSGDIQLGENEVLLSKAGVATLTFNEDGKGESELTVKANENSKILVYSGVPVKEDVVAYGPFVMNTMEEIKQAYRDYHAGKLGPSAV
ncbi:pirin family protein [Bacillus cereus]|uniref:Pirin family protein n=1 Tax=Bacillus cereus TaxID=1396 RepID=A0A9X9A6B5_BACCE|nr:pirin family protein [Bacillus cereus]